jgi:hypothetical protein
MLGTIVTDQWKWVQPYAVQDKGSRVASEVSRKIPKDWEITGHVHS